jgi:hypothetical protein
MHKYEVQLHEGEGQMHERLDSLHGVMTNRIPVMQLEEIGEV